MSDDIELLSLRTRLAKLSLGIGRVLLGKAGEFDESKHPRAPKGSPKGGKFAPKSGADATHYTAAEAARMLNFRPPDSYGVTDRKGLRSAIDATRSREQGMRAADVMSRKEGRGANPLRMYVALQDFRTHAIARLDQLSPRIDNFAGPKFPLGGGSGTGTFDINRNGVNYHFTGKTGTDFATGRSSYEYGHKDGRTDRRAWVDSKGHVTEED